MNWVQLKRGQSAMRSQKGETSRADSRDISESAPEKEMQSFLLSMHPLPFHGCNPGGACFCDARI
jgi:hypothetical protein